jgi:hypothetical protein
MRLNFTPFVTLLFLFWYNTSTVIEIEGGKLEDVVVAAGGAPDSAVITKFTDGWDPDGPNSFDVDKEGNIYILDWLGGRVQKYDKEGKRVRTFLVVPGAQKYDKPPQIDDIAVDNWGDLYVVGALIGGIPSRSIFKFSPEGRLLLEIPNMDAIETGNLGHVVYWLLLTDESSKVYNFGDELLGGIAIYSSEGELKEVIDRCEYEYKDKGIVQKELGNDIYFRVSKYLMRTSLEGHKESCQADTVAILPDWIRLRKFAEYPEREVGWIEYPYTLIGFDRDSCFYFHQKEDFYGSRTNPTCLTHRIEKFHLEKGKLIEIGEVEIDFERGKAECSDKELFDFQKQFIVSGDGTIYFLHGTVDTIRVSKITMNELKPEPFVTIYHTPHAIEIEGGKIEDVVVADSGHFDSTFVTHLYAGWDPTGPTSFDIDKDNNIYVLDQLSGRVQEFSKAGEWISSFPVSTQDESIGEDVAIDNWGDPYVNESGRIVKYLPGGKLLYRVPITNEIKEGSLSPSNKFILTDKNGRVYNFRISFSTGVAIYDREGKFIGTIHHPEESTLDRYHDFGIVQKEVGNNIYFRVKKYLLKTTLEDYFQTGKIDTVAILPNLIRLQQYTEGLAGEKHGIEMYPWILMGFDKDSCFYFYKEERLSDDTLDLHVKYNILKYRLEKNELVDAGKTTIDLERDLDKELHYFIKRFIVTGDGIIYFLHGTVDKIKVSKITMDELKSKP